MKKLIMCLISILALNKTVFANNLVEIQTSITEDKTQAIKIFESYEETNETDLKTLLFEDFEQDGFKYTKNSVDIEKVTKTDTIKTTESLDVILTKEEKEKLSNLEIINLFQDGLPYEKDGYKGILQKDLTTLKIEPNKTESTTTYTNQTITLNQKKEYYGLESNDYALIPKTITKNGVTLNLVDANFVSTNNEAISSVANTGVGTLYNCTASYSGSYTKKIPNTKTNVIDYKATMEYKGDISKEIFEKNLITVSYVGNKMLDLTVPVVATTSGGILGGVIFFFVKGNVRVYNLINGSYQLIGKCKITEKDKTINLTHLSMKAQSNIYKIVIDNNIYQKLNNQEINITLNNITKLQKLQNQVIDVTF